MGTIIALKRRFEEENARFDNELFFDNDIYLFTFFGLYA